MPEVEPVRVAPNDQAIRFPFGAHDGSASWPRLWVRRRSPFPSTLTT